MSLNQLYFDHQISLMCADRAESRELREEHQLGSRQIADRIGRIQNGLGAAAACGWDALLVTGEVFVADRPPCTSGEPLNGVSELEGRNVGTPALRKPKQGKLTGDSARRQSEITSLAFLLLGREKALVFLNNEHSGLGARPLDLATASAEGRARVEVELGRMTYRQPEEG